MAKKPPLEQDEVPRLRVSREDAMERISKQIGVGAEIEGRAVENKQQVEALIDDRDNWDRYTRDLLSALFTTKKLRSEFERAGYLPFRRGMNLNEHLKYAKDQAKSQVQSLRSILSTVGTF
jgi:hypothetical protein